MQPDGLSLSITSLAELHEGVVDSRRPVESERLLGNFVKGLRVLGIDDETCRVFARERGIELRGCDCDPTAPVFDRMQAAGVPDEVLAAMVKARPTESIAGRSGREPLRRR